MSSMSSLHIQVGLPTDLSVTAARLYADAFQRKLSPILGPRPTLEAILQAALYPPNAIVALRDEALLGLAGIQHQQKHFVDVGWSQLRQFHGTLGALGRAGLGLLLMRPHRPDELLMDGIAVDSSARGQGIGSLLLEEVCDFAHREGYARVRLDVIDTNPGARRLYERHGFRAVHTQSLGWLKPVFGFGSATEMVKSVKEETP